MTTPTLEEILARAAEIELPEREAQKFFNHFESKGWKVGRAPMQRWRSALNNWKLNWEERYGNASHRGNGVHPTTQVIVQLKELEEIQKRMKTIYNSYSEHQSWDAEDIDTFRKLRDRKVELKKLLGMQV